MPEEWQIDEDSFTADDLRELESNANLGDAHACYLLGTRLITGDGITKDVPGGMFWYCEAIKQGHVLSKWNAGSVFIDGEDGVAENHPLGLRLIVEAAEAGDNSACLFLSRCYEVGRHGYQINQDEAEKWQKRAWENNLQEFDRPWDPIQEYDPGIKRPAITKL